MSGHEPFCFVHSGDFHLERPLSGLEEAPPELRRRLIDAPYLAATAVFDTTLEERADFLVLCGDLLDAAATGPRGPLFLVEQFERLREKNIDVFWMTGAVDAAECWPEEIPLPDNVVRLGQQTEERVVHREHATLARVVGVRRGEDFAPLETARTGDADLFTVAVCYDPPDVASLAKAGADYWALGGRSAPAAPLEDRPRVNFAGSPQGRRPDEIGKRSCTLIRVDERGQPRFSRRATDAVRWRRETLEVAPGWDSGELWRRLESRAAALAGEAEERPLLVAWRLTGSGPLLKRLVCQGLDEELLGRLRRRFSQPYSASLDVNVPEPPTAGDESFLAAYLRTIGAMEKDSSPLDLSHFAAGKDSVAPIDDAQRHDVFRRATWLGAELLSGNPGS